MAHYILVAIGTSHEGEESDSRMSQLGPVQPSCPVLGVSLLQMQSSDPATLVPWPLQPASVHVFHSEATLVPKIAGITPDGSLFT